MCWNVQSSRGIGRASRALILLALLAALAHAQRSALKVFNVADGLPNDQINSIRRDSRGFLWLCTGDGLARFDGYNFVTFGIDQGLPSANISDILETRNGDYWVATAGGLARLAASGVGSGAKLFTAVFPVEQNARARNVTTLFEDRAGTLWIGTSDGLFRLDKAGATYNRFDIGIPNDFPEQRFIADMLQDRQGPLWVATPDGLYRSWPDSTWTRYTKRDGLPTSYFQCLFQDHRGWLWAGTREHSFFRLIADNTRRPPAVEFYKGRDGVPSWIYQLFETPDQHMWVASNQGVFEYLPDWLEHPASFRTYTGRNGLNLQNIAALAEDSAGNLWLGTLGAGAVRLAHEGFETFDEQDRILTGNAIFEDQAGEICFRGYIADPKRIGHPVQSFGQFDGKRFQLFMPAALKGMDQGWVASNVTLQSRSGEWWIGTGEGLLRFGPTPNVGDLARARPIAIYTAKNGLATTQVARLFEDSRRGIWVVTIASAGSSLSRWDPGSNAIQNLSNAPNLPSPHDEMAQCFAEDRQGNVWIAFASGLARYRDGSFRLFGHKDGLPVGAIAAMHVDRLGRLWLASRSGLLRLDNPGAEPLRFVTYSTAQGLSSNRINVVTEDRFGRIYAGAGRGLDRLDPASGNVKHFSAGNGLPTATFLSAYCDRTGALWFGTLKGVSRFEPRIEQTRPPPVILTGVKVAGAPHRIPALGAADLSLPTLNPGENQVQIDFVGLSFVAGETLRYEYKLENADTEWSAPAESRSVNYARLAPGVYRFLVRARNSDGLVSPVPATMSFEILPPFWRRWWFLTAATLLAALIAYASHRYRVAQLLEIERMRTHIAADLHDDIGSNLTQIAILSEVAQSRMPASDSEMNTSLSSIARISRESVASMSDIVWAINPKRDRLADLAGRMRRFANEVTGNRGIQLRFRAPGSEQDPKLGVEMRHDLFLIFKEALHNAVRHSSCDSIEVELDLDRSLLTLRVTDNGAGFDLSPSNEGQGMGNMRRRAAKIGGQLEVRSSRGQGTEIVLTVPLRA